MRDRRPALAVFTALLGAAALLVPLWASEPDRAAGLLLLGGVVVEFVQSFRRKTGAAQLSAWTNAGYTLLLALVVLNAAWLAATALAIFIAVPFALDAMRRARTAARQMADAMPGITAADVLRVFGGGRILTPEEAQALMAVEGLPQ